MMRVDELKYGNPTREDVQNIQIPTFLDDLVAPLKKNTPFLNSSVATREELNLLVTYSKQEQYSARRNIFDRELVPYIIELFKNNGIDEQEVGETAKSVVADVLPLITKLKYAFQRPRPQQLAYYYDLAFYPAFSHYVCSPSYPSGHTVMAVVLCEILAMQYSSEYPDCDPVMRKFAGEVMESRLYLGVHYPSDNTFALRVADAIINHPKFRLKYGF